MVKGKVNASEADINVGAGERDHGQGWRASMKPTSQRLRFDRQNGLVLLSFPPFIPAFLEPA
jgi:hypothetical protein